MAWLLIVFTAGALTLDNQKNNTLGWDIFGYYLYLPAQFIYNDIGLEDHTWLDSIKEEYAPSNTWYQFHQQENGASVIQYTSGQAWLYAPFFAIGHAIALSTTYPADGFSAPYEWALNAGLFAYFALGVWLLVLLARRYFSEKWVAVGLLALYFGTNLIQLSGQYMLSPHIGIFILYSALLYVSDSYSRSRKSKHAWLIGLLCGLIILNRPTEIAVLLVPLLWGYGAQTSPGWKVAKKNPLDFLIVAGVMAFIGFPHLLYWKVTAGSWIHLSYENPAEGLDWTSPHTLPFLFSFRKGWFIYTPLALFAVAGIFLSRRRLRQVFVPTLLVLIISIYIMSSWTTWYYAGGSYSSRTLVNIYPILLLPLTLALKASWESRIRPVLVPLAIVLIAMNLMHAWQWNQGILDKTRMTSKAYKNLIFATEWKPEWEKDLLVYRTSETHQKMEHPEWYKTTALDSVPLNKAPIAQLQGKPAFELNQHNPYTPAWEKPFSDLTQKDHVWLRIKTEVWIPDSFASDTPPTLVVHAEHRGKSYAYRAYSSGDWSAHLGEWQTLAYEYLSPPVRLKSDVLKTYVWHRANEPVYLKNLTVEVLERKECCSKKP